MALKSMARAVTQDAAAGAARARLRRPAVACAALACALLLLPSVTARDARAQNTQAQSVATDEEFERGKRLLAQGDAKGAADALKRASRRRKNDPEVWYQLGLALSHLGKAKDARKAFETAVRLRPDWADARAGLAFALVSLNKLPDAEREARRALDADPNNAGAHYAVAVARFTEEKFPEALAEAEAALRSTPSFPAAARLAADAVLNAYIQETMRQGRRHPLTPGAGEQEREAMHELREPALAPYRARMRELAERLEALASAQPSHPDAEDWREQAGTLRYYARPSSERDTGDPVLRRNQVMRKAVITFKPEPGYAPEAREQGVEGVVRLRAVLMPDGKVRHIVALRWLPGGLTERAVAAARKIRFVPASVDGHPVAQYVVLEYNFNIY